LVLLAPALVDPLKEQGEIEDWRFEFCTAEAGT